ncbi:GntR family transcriptional regulator [Streptomyces tsukubensis]|uniref:GntR family transcriptional regulator n=1 Tax=Streptomyces tsukubensis TaxID=83656 RepID=A0A1V4AB09_9ACTN|nr:GntR family transcriptional regulator [Streptomyces tsukubensis]OON81018.1 GntR family transcriptional regulator [Streptomyces tsukubensis]QFR94855.1 UTRA domain-containing protein [Streptomyces tsukubensis]
MPSRRQVIADDIRDQISAGKFKTGERLPSEAQLAFRYVVSTPTLRSALAVLQGEGLVEKIHGKGNYVRYPRRRITYVGGGGTCAEAAAVVSHLRVTVRTTQLRAHGHLVGLLGVAARSPLTEFLCISHEGESPHGLARVYVPRDLAPDDVPEGLPFGKSLGVVLAELRPPLAEVQERVTARPATAEEAVLLRISRALAVLAITRVAIDNTGRVVEAAFVVLPGDRADALFITRHVTDEKDKKR